MWKLLRQENGEWVETGETFAGTQEELIELLAKRQQEDGWIYKAEDA